VYAPEDRTDEMAATAAQPPAPNPLPDPEAIHLLRVLDAAANRAGEGLRAVEDYVRFVLDDRHLTGRCKQLRHDLAAAMEGISTGHRMVARETLSDVGTSLATPSEGRREKAADVLVANFTRLQEGLRSLEEFGKLVDPQMSAGLKQLRYRHVLQLRDKQLDDRRLLSRARLLRELSRGAETLLIINDRPDLAVLARADGVHVGQEDLSVKDARTIVGPKALVGVSTHSIEQARQAVLDGANYIGVGPTFPSGTKQFEQFPGMELLRSVAAEIRLPAFAIGGITRENLPEVLSAGFRRIALSGAITTAADPAVAARGLHLALE